MYGLFIREVLVEAIVFGLSLYPWESYLVFSELYLLDVSKRTVLHVLMGILFFSKLSSSTPVESSPMPNRVLVSIDVHETCRCFAVDGSYRDI